MRIRMRQVQGGLLLKEISISPWKNPVASCDQLALYHCVGYGTYILICVLVPLWDFSPCGNLSDIEEVKFTNWHLMFFSAMFGESCEHVATGLFCHCIWSSGGLRCKLLQMASVFLLARANVQTRGIFCLVLSFDMMGQTSKASSNLLSTLYPCKPSTLMPALSTG